MWSTLVHYWGDFWFFFFLNTERAYRVIGSVGLCILKYPRRTCHLLDSCFCSGTVAWWLSFYRDPCCTRHWARALGRGIAHSPKPCHTSVWVWGKGPRMDKQCLSCSLCWKQYQLSVYLSLHTRLCAWNLDGKKAAIWGVARLHFFLGHSMVSQTHKARCSSPCVSGDTTEIC